MRPLTAKEQAFLDAYLECGSYAEAYRRAYSVKHMKPDTVRHRALEVAQRPHVVERLQLMQQEAAARHQVNADRVIEEYAAVAFSDIREVIGVQDGELRVRDLDTLTRSAAAAIASVRAKVVGSVKEQQDGAEVRFPILSIEVRMHPKVDGLNALARHLGLFKADNDQARDANLEALYRLIDGRTSGLPKLRGGEAG